MYLLSQCGVNAAFYHLHIKARCDFFISYFSSLLLFFDYYSCLFSCTTFLCPMNTPLSSLNCVARSDARDDPPASVVRYMDDFRNRLNGRRFADMRLLGAALTVRDERHCRDCDTAMDACEKRW